MSRANHFRDTTLGDAIATLAVPQHRPTFFAELAERLPATRQPRLPRRARVVGIAALAVAVALTVFVALPRVRSSGVASAADVEARVTAAIASVHSARGLVTYTSVDARDGTRTKTRQRFTIAASGDARIVDVSAGTESVYDAERGVERAITTSASLGTGRFYAERRGLAPGPPDPAASQPLFERQLGAVTRALAAAHDPRVREVKLHGRPAWQLELEIAPNTIESDVDHLTLTVDRTTGFPLHVLATLHGKFRSELRVDELELDQPLPPNAFRLAFPARAEVLRTNARFAEVDPSRVAAVAGYEPLVPARVPTGFRPATVAVAASADSTGPGGSNPPSRSVVSLSYRRGLEQIVVTTRLRGEGEWRDPFAAEGQVPRGERVRLAHGAFTGTTARVVVDARTPPHLWAVGDRLVLTISGDLSRAELVAVAEALSRS